MSEHILAALFAIAAALVTAGVALYDGRAGLVAAGALLACWSWLVAGEVDDE